MHLLTETSVPGTAPCEQMLVENPGMTGSSGKSKGSVSVIISAG
jgi:hypothetical protein